MLTVLCYTVVCRKMGELTQFQPIPFYNYWDGSSVWLVMGEGLLNVCLFVPFGFLLRAAFRNMPTGVCLMVGTAFSECIEALQWICRCGCCEANDVIHNAVGCLVGVWLAKRCMCKNHPETVGGMPINP